MYRNDQGVTDVLSNTFLVAMTVSLMALVVLTVTPRLGPDPQDHAILGVEAGENTLRIIHQGGDPVYLSGVEVHLMVDGSPTVLAGADFTGALGETWTIGEVLCISGTSSGCADLGGSTISELRVVARGIEATGSQATTGWTGHVDAISPPP